MYLQETIRPETNRVLPISAYPGASEPIWRDHLQQLARKRTRLRSPADSPGECYDLGAGPEFPVFNRSDLKYISVKFSRYS